MDIRSSLSHRANYAVISIDQQAADLVTITIDRQSDDSGARLVNPAPFESMPINTNVLDAFTRLDAQHLKLIPINIVVRIECHAMQIFPLPGGMQGKVVIFQTLTKLYDFR